MKVTTARRLNKVADLLETYGLKLIWEMAEWVWIALIDGVYGKGKYRKRGSRPRPIIHRTINNTRTIIVKSPKETK